MLETARCLKTAVDFPQEGESVSSPHYTFRIRAALNAEKVEVCVDGSPWQLCRYSAGFWWYDWAGYSAGEHELVARILPFDSRNYILKTRRFRVDFASAASPAMMRKTTQYSLLTSAEPWTMAQVAQILAKESIDISGLMTVAVGDNTSIQFLADKSSGLSARLEAAGIPVLERDVFELRLPNRPDQLERLTRALAEQGIAIRSLYGTADGDSVKLVLAVDQFKAAEAAVERLEQRAPAEPSASRN